LGNECNNMKRNDFIKAGALTGVTTLLAGANAFAKIITENDMNKLVDANGNYIQQSLPYNENFLKPYMDTETKHLHYAFHHGGP
jgi:superoxide dismutase, Fe-Mn family